MKFFSPGHRASAVRPSGEGACHNCHAPVSTRFCGECGHAAVVHVPTAHEFLHHYIGHFVAAEGKLWRTLGQLLARPGQLTLDFLRGRRGQFIDPLRLLLTVSLVVFLGMRGYAMLLPPVDAAAATPTASVASAAIPAPLHMPPLKRALYKVFARSSSHFAANYARFDQMTGAQLDANFLAFWLKQGPTIILCLIPVIALCLKIVHLGRGWRYGEHLVFAIHLQTFTLLATLAGAFFDMVSPLPWRFAMLAVPLYALLALRRVYGGGWAVLALRWLALLAMSGYYVDAFVWICHFITLM